MVIDAGTLEELHHHWVFRALLWLALVLCLLLSGGAYGLQYPIMYDVENKQFSGSLTRDISYKQRVQDVAGANYIPPKGWMVGIFIRVGDYVEFYSGTEADGRKTISALAMMFYNESGNRYNNFQTNHARPSDTCVGYGAALYPITSWASVRFPPGSCTYVPPGSNSCNVNTKSITLDHGILTNGEVHLSANKIDVYCSASMKVKLNFEQSKLSLKQGLEAQLNVLGSNGGALRLSRWNNSVTLQSKV